MRKAALYDTLFRLFIHDALEFDRQYIPYLTPSQLARTPRPPLMLSPVGGVARSKI